MTQQIIKDRILNLYQEKQNAGELPSSQQLDGYYRLFRQKFGPEVLASLDGEVLLNLMHDFGTRDSLVYWLEFKNDSEFPAIFGSIAGGSALKYGIFRRKETGTWTTGSPQKQIEIPVEQAIEIARRHRDQLIRGVSVIQSMPDSTDDATYLRLQEDLDREAPDVQNTAWGHKYFNLLCPTKLDDYHVANFQRFHLIKLLQAPPDRDGRYVCAGRFVALAKDLEIPINSLTTLLNEVNGRPYSYWRIGTRGGENNESFWDEMQRENVVSLGWEKLGNLSWLDYSQESKDKLRSQLQEQYYPNLAVAGQTTSKILSFVTVIREGDIVLAADGVRIFGVGRVIGGYEFQSGSEFPHRRPVEWLSLDKWQLPEEKEGLRFAVYFLRQPKNLIAIEEKLLDPKNPVPGKDTGRTNFKDSPRPVIRLEGIPGRIQNVLERKQQIILYGPPGTGKTYWAMRTANNLASHTIYGKPYIELSEAEKQMILGQTGQANGLVRRCTFHPAYGYEDFIEGYRPVSTNGQLAFEKRSGIFKAMCEAAQKDPGRPYYLIIDEINRGDIPRIFGELLTLLEKDKRGQLILLPLSGDLFQVPDNVYLIGTMNTADRSIALLDTALRRRFGFLELLPDARLLDISIEGLPLGPWLDALNERIRAHIGRDARNLQVGHAYFLEGEKPISDKARFIRVLREDILPLLEEYCYEDYDTLEEILGGRLIDLKNQQFNEDLLAPERWDQLLEALLAMTPELMTSSQVLKTQLNEPDAQITEEETADGEAG